MKKIGLIGILFLLTLLCGCQKENTRTDTLQRQYQAIESLQISAEVVCHLSAENRPFSVECSYNKDKGATTSITAPEEVKGISATVSDDDLTVTYDGLILSAGTVGEICPANCLPYLLHAVADGYVLEWGQETLEGEDCLRIAFDTTSNSGDKILCTVWFDADNVPAYAEFAQNDTVILTARILSIQAK